jgi:predicted DNA-binding protein
MGKHKTYYIRDETSEQLSVLSKHYKKSKSQILRELVEQRYNAINRHRIEREDRRLRETGKENKAKED